MATSAVTPPLPLAWPTLLVFWPVFVWVFLPEMGIMRRGPLAGSVPAEDRGSLHIVFIGFSLAVAAAFLLPLLFPRAVLPGSPTVWFCVGLLTLIAGSLLRRHCFRVLGGFFTAAVTIRDDHRVIDTGAYRWVRHPSYSAAFLLVLGIAIVVPAYLYRAHVEEEALRSSLGAPYARFAASRGRFIPFIY
jgi:protein-S-isoprenylcysteine O-methyltransferase Ste14